MGNGYYATSTILAALGCGLMAGLFFAFSVCVMRALARRPAPEAVAAMQAMNTAIINPVFLVVFLGAGAACAWTIMLSLTDWGLPGSLFSLAGGTVYLAGGLAVTIVFSLPRNNALAAVDPTGEAHAAAWGRYLSTWTAWNHVRTVAATLAALLLTVAAARSGLAP